MAIIRTLMTLPSRMPLLVIAVDFVPDLAVQHTL
jgi:hypothetical protein